MINILYVYGDILRRGGMEACMMNYFRGIDRSKLHIDFVVQRNSKNEIGVYDEEIKAAGSNVFYLPKYGKHPFEHRRKLRALFSCGKYQIVHAHSDATNYRILKLAKKCGIPVRISHAHNTAHILNSELKMVYYEFCRNRLSGWATDRWACSAAAGVWLYQNNDFNILPNMIDVDRFRYNELIRKNMRTRFNIEDSEIVLGHVGRFDYQKNHAFLIEIIKKLGKNGYKLLLVGEGEYFDYVKSMVDDLGLCDSVIFAGSTPDVYKYYNIMDIFLLPSLFEGFPIVLVEAQANGLPCIVSNHVTRETNLTGLTKFLPLETSKWVKSISNTPLIRDEEAHDKLTRQGYDLCGSNNMITEMYIDAFQRSGWLDL